MKTQILDADALRRISPAAISAYARAEGWQKEEPYGAHADVYAGQGRPEIVLPRTDRLADYAAVVSRLIGVFSDQTQLDQTAVYKDLIGADRDVVRVRNPNADDDGSVSLEVGVEIVSNARDMLLAAACAARTPQPLYRAGANREAIEYMRRVRLGQTERGSFVVTLLAPVPPQLQLQPKLDPSWVSFDDEPLERKVTRRLVSALEASRSAAELALSGEGSAFEQAVASGVSANLCEAVANLIDQSHGLDVSVTWARTRPTPEPMRRIAFSGSDAEILKEAARTFRSRQPKPDVILFGTVNKLKRDQEQVEGSVTLRAMIDDRAQSVTAVLDQANYEVAVAAHGSKTPVIVKGDLERVKQRWQLTNASILQVQADDDATDEGEADDDADSATISGNAHDRMERIANHALTLLKESDDPEAEMEWAEGRLFEAGLWLGNPPNRKNAFEWTQQVISENPEMIDQDVPLYLATRGSHPEEAENFEALILALIPTEGGL